MQITLTLNLNELSPEQVNSLGSLMLIAGVEQAPSKFVQPAPKKAVAKKAAAPTPEPMAEEPIIEEPEVEEEVGADDITDEDLLALAVKRATEMVAGGEAAQVREALDAAGASRVRELNKDNVREFFRALS